MLVHLNPVPRHPARVVVVGAAGFVGRAVVARLEKDGVPALSLGRNELDLLAADAGDRLAGLLRPSDTLVAVAARAPVKNPDMLVENMIIAKALMRALDVPLSHVVNVSSDAVYADSTRPLTEDSSAAPDSLHGVMHLARELMFRAAAKAPLAIVRPTLIYGPGDPHNGYGPNRFRRQAAHGEGVALFGDGEERRDHVYIADVAELIACVLYRRSSGNLNIATGTVLSFREIAERVIGLSGRSVPLVRIPRAGSVPHNGYRAFDISVSRAAFPEFSYTPLAEGLALSQAAG